MYLTTQLNISHFFTHFNDQIVLFLTIEFSISHIFKLGLIGFDGISTILGYSYGDVTAGTPTETINSDWLDKEIKRV